MRRSLAIFTVLTLLMALPATAEAKKGGGKGPPEQNLNLFEVTMTIPESSNGLATTCGDDPFIMKEGYGGLVADGSQGTSTPIRIACIRICPRTRPLRATDSLVAMVEQSQTRRLSGTGCCRSRIPASCGISITTPTG
jgi:hypothetical protein